MLNGRELLLMRFGTIKIDLLSFSNNFFSQKTKRLFCLWKYRLNRFWVEKILRQPRVHQIPLKFVSKKDVEKMSRLSDTGTAVNLVKHRSGAIVVVPGSAKTLEKYDQAHKDDVELIDSEIKE